MKTKTKILEFGKIDDSVVIVIENNIQVEMKSVYVVHNMIFSIILFSNKILQKSWTNELWY